MKRLVSSVISMAAICTLAAPALSQSFPTRIGVTLPGSAGHFRELGANPACIKMTYGKVENSCSSERPFWIFTPNMPGFPIFPTGSQTQMETIVKVTAGSKSSDINSSFATACIAFIQNRNGTLKSFTNWQAPTSINPGTFMTLGTLQRFADETIGVDCQFGQAFGSEKGFIGQVYIESIVPPII